MMATEKIALSSIGQIGIAVKDLDAATAFYRDVLGLRLLFQAPPGMSFFDLGGIRLMLGAAEKREQLHPASILYYKVGDIRAAASGLKEKGVRFDAEPHLVHKDARHELWLAFFRDCEQNVLALMSEVPIA
jgi:methylmalonyl-CoA/ethylmalonyl-CoA epimerase